MNTTLVVWGGWGLIGGKQQLNKEALIAFCNIKIAGFKLWKPWRPTTTTTTNYVYAQLAGWQTKISFHYFNERLCGEGASTTVQQQSASRCLHNVNKFNLKVKNTHK